jgi:hypothetical protein
VKYNLLWGHFVEKKDVMYILRLDILIFGNEIFDKDDLNYLLNHVTDTTSFHVIFLPLQITGVKS